ncbi:hypothetical protein M885DRAFT_331750 [Pelagophyceae sp. CCMP2097]|nr:hypothetical protein M885DRAFT_331750 [Pelagophyceae sp. CCMP2097]
MRLSLRAVFVYAATAEGVRLRAVPDSDCGAFRESHPRLAKLLSRRCAKDAARRAECCGVAQRVEQLGAAGKNLATQTLRHGGWLCRALFALERELRQAKASRGPVDGEREAATDVLCGFNSSDPATAQMRRHRGPRPSSGQVGGPGPGAGAGDDLVVVGVHHNGLGNTLFQYCAARLFAWGVGARYASTRILEAEGASAAKLPPHSGEAWTLFMQIFDPPGLVLSAAGSSVDSETGARPDAKCAALTPTKSEYAANGTILYGQRPMDAKRVRTTDTLRSILDSLLQRDHALHRRRDGPRGAASLHNSTGEPDDFDASAEDWLPEALPASAALVSGEALRCIRLIGFFQDYVLYRDLTPLLRSWLPMKRPSLSEEPKKFDVVVHIRLCNAPYHVYRYYSVGNYFGTILDVLAPRAAKRGGGVRVITTCDASKPGVTRDLVEHYGARVVKPTLAADGHRNTAAADFFYLARAKTLVVSESTFSYWAALLGEAQTVHAPGSGAVPVPWHEPRYTFHDVVEGTFWGKFENDAIVYTSSLHRPRNVTETRADAPKPPQPRAGDGPRQHAGGRWPDLQQARGPENARPSGHKRPARRGAKKRPLSRQADRLAADGGPLVRPQ